MIIEIPVKPHIKSFLTNPLVWGVEPIEARRNSSAGNVIFCLLSQYPSSTSENDVELLGIPKGKVLISIKIKFQLKDEFLTDEGLIRLGDLLEDYFSLALQFFSIGRMDRLPSEQGAVKRFYELLKIDPDDYDYDAAFKVVQRCRAKANKTPPK
jgi:hypothetical protein